MDLNVTDAAVYVVLSLAISVGGVYFFMVEPLNSKAKAGIKAQLESPHYGPFDEALAKSAGMEDLLKKKPQWKPPVAPVLNFDLGNDFPKFQ